MGKGQHVVLSPDPATSAVTLATSPSPSVFDSSDAEDVSNMSEIHPEGLYGVSASRSPVHLQFKVEGLQTNDVSMRGLRAMRGGLHAFANADCTYP